MLAALTALAVWLAAPPDQHQVVTPRPSPVHTPDPSGPHVTPDYGPLVTLLADIESERRWAAAMDALRDAVGRAIDEARRIDATRPDASRGSSSVPVDGSVWDRLAQCESGQRWDIRNPPYSGGLQFMDATWRGHGGEEFAPLAYLASREEQIVVAERVLASQGWGAWPACSRKLGLR